MKWQPEDVIVGVLALAVTFPVVIPLIRGNVPEHWVSVYQEIITAVIALIAVYLGSKFRK